MAVEVAEETHAEPRATWTEAAEEWIAEGAAEGLSPGGLGGRRRLLRPRIMQTRANLGHGDRLDLTRELGLAVLAGMREDGRQASSAVTVAGNLSAFARWAVARGLVAPEDATLLALRRPRAPRDLPEPLSVDEMRRLLRATRNPRDRLLMRVLLGTGLRVSECAGLTLDDIVERLETTVIRVRRGKGGKDRYVPAGLPGDPLGPALAEYIDLDRQLPRDDPERHLWLEKHRAAGVYRTMTAWAIWRVVDRAGQAAGVPRVHPHLFRHTWATRAIAAGIPTEAVRIAGGWQSPAVMQRYLHVGIGDVVAAWERAASR